MTDWILPALLALTALWGLHRQVDVYGALVRGGSKGLELLVRILPALVGLLTAVAMLRASGALELLGSLCGPLFQRLGIPPELLPLMLVRPLSGSGALAAAGDLIQTHGPDSLIGRTAAVMMGSTETTFYTTAVYFGAAGVTRSRHTIPSALTADLTGFLLASLTVRWLFA